MTVDKKESHQREVFPSIFRVLFHPKLKDMRVSQKSQGVGTTSNLGKRNTQFLANEM